MSLRIFTLATAAALITTPLAASDEFTPMLQTYLEDSIRGWAEDPAIISALRAANAETADMTEAEIIAMDNLWRGEVGSASTPTIDAVLGHPASDFLRQQVAASGGQISEVFLMDSVGLNVAASSVTSDMWQGDEAKFTDSYGADGVHIGAVEFDESAQTYLGQISLSITDPETGELLGAMTVGVDAESLL